MLMGLFFFSMHCYYGESLIEGILLAKVLGFRWTSCNFASAKCLGEDENDSNHSGWRQWHALWGADAEAVPGVGRQADPYAHD